jgi:hypothetical protein
LSLTSCAVNDGTVRKFGIGLNHKRKDIGLPILDSNWRLVKNTDGVLLWLPETEKDSLAYVSKLIRHDRNKIFFEENKFYGKEKYATIDGIFREVLYITCSFNDEEEILHWNCEYRGPNEIFGKPITKKEADSLLKIWNLDSFN